VSEYEKLSIGPPLSVPRRVLNLINEIGGSKILGILLLAFALLILVALFWPAIGHMGGTPEGARIMRLRVLNDATESYCRQWDGRWPPHAAILVASGYPQLRDFFDEDIDPPLRNRAFGCINLDAFDPSRPEDVTALLAVANAADTSEPYYRFADVWLTRLSVSPVISASALGGDLIQAWALPNDDGSCFVLFADGHIESITPANWGGVWADDAKARQSLGIAPIDPPPAGVGE
jgi:hypothetical protein